MFRTLRTLTVASSLAVVTAVCFAAAPAGAGSGGDTTTSLATAERRSIVATGTARVRGTPDVLNMTLGVTSRGRTVGEALDRNTSAAKKVMAVLLDSGIDKRDIQTTNFSIGPVYGSNGDDITGYQVSNLVIVDLRDLDKAGGVIDRAAEAGGDDVIVRNVSFDIDDTSDLIATARADAVKRARNQATQLAEAAGVQLGDVMTITESSYDPGRVASDLVTQERAAASVPIQPGSEELSVSVSVTFSIR